MESILAPAQSSASPISSINPPLEHKMAVFPCRVPFGAGLSSEADGFDVGLVSSQTSGADRYSKPMNPPIEKMILVDRAASRVKRLRSSVLTAARLHCQEKSKWTVWMVDPTYANGADGKLHWEANHMSKLVRHIRDHLKRKGVEMRYVWVMEFGEKNGRQHYHLLVWLPLGMTLPHADERGWWPHGMTRTSRARNAIGYIAKYASKADSLHRPEAGARMHGNGGLRGDALLEQRWWKLPAWARERVVAADCCRRQKGGGLLIPDTGEILRSPWRVAFIGGKVYIWKQEEPERSSEAPVLRQLTEGE